jgi:hypothetical protein
LTSIVCAAAGRPPGLMLSVLLVSLFGLVVARQVLALRDRDTPLGIATGAPDPARGNSQVPLRFETSAGACAHPVLGRSNRDVVAAAPGRIA